MTLLRNKKKNKKNIISVLIRGVSVHNCTIYESLAGVSVPIIYEVFSKSLETFPAASVLAAGIRSRRDSVVRSSIRLLCRIFFFWSTSRAAVRPNPAIHSLLWSFVVRGRIWCILSPPREPWIFCLVTLGICATAFVEASEKMWSVVELPFAQCPPCPCEPPLRTRFCRFSIAYRMKRVSRSRRRRRQMKFFSKFGGIMVDCLLGVAKAFNVVYTLWVCPWRTILVDVLIFFQLFNVTIFRLSLAFKYLY